MTKDLPFHILQVQVRLYPSGLCENASWYTSLDGKATLCLLTQMFITKYLNNWQGEGEGEMVIKSTFECFLNSVP